MARHVLLFAENKTACRACRRSIEPRPRLRPGSRLRPGRPACSTKGSHNAPTPSGRCRWWRNPKDIASCAAIRRCRVPGIAAIASGSKPASAAKWRPRSGVVAVAGRNSAHRATTAPRPPRPAARTRPGRRLRAGPTAVDKHEAHGLACEWRQQRHGSSGRSGPGSRWRRAHADAHDIREISPVDAAVVAARQQRNATRPEAVQRREAWHAAWC